MRLPHGYTNATEVVNGTVGKTYLGPEADERHARERTALRVLEDLLPVPALLGDDEKGLEMSFAEGRHGQELIDAGESGRVLHVCGRLDREVQAVPTSSLKEFGDPSDGVVLVHGDFGPQNLLIDTETWTPSALLDWEFASLGNPVEDIAWAEWILRTHHPDAVSQTDAFFEGFGDRPSWEDRHASMLRKCGWALGFVRRGGGDDRLWRERLAATQGFHALPAD
jgi:aminoglycoside phosphotransferase (APT) family kinase protein